MSHAALVSVEARLDACRDPSQIPGLMAERKLIKDVVDEGALCASALAHMTEATALHDELRDALMELLDAAPNVGTNAALNARSRAWAAWLASTPAEQRKAAVRLAQTRNPAIATFAEAIGAYGTTLLQEIASTPATA